MPMPMLLLLMLLIIVLLLPLLSADDLIKKIKFSSLVEFTSEFDAFSFDLIWRKGAKLGGVKGDSGKFCEFYY
jgi:hypothetical protein